MGNTSTWEWIFFIMDEDGLSSMVDMYLCLNFASWPESEAKVVFKIGYKISILFFVLSKTEQICESVGGKKSKKLICTFLKYKDCIIEMQIQLELYLLICIRSVQKSAVQNVIFLNYFLGKSSTLQGFEIIRNIIRRLTDSAM